jgi:hypothetical protein
MVGARRRIRIADHGHIALPADLMREYHLKAGDEVAVELTDRRSSSGASFSRRGRSTIGLCAEPGSS